MERPARWLRFVEEVAADVRYAVRALRLAPFFAATSIGILALGTGAAMALWSAVRVLLIDPIAAVEPDRLVRLRWTGDNLSARSSSEYGYSADTLAGERPTATFSYPIFVELRGATRTLESVFASAPLELHVMAGDEPEVANGLLVSGAYFDVLGVRARIGRVLGAGDDDRTASPVAVISHPYWLRRFDADPGVVGRVIAVNQAATTIVGVLPADHVGVQRPGARAADIHLPLASCTQLGRDDEQCFSGSNWWLQIMGRAKPGVTPQQVQGELGGLFAAADQAATEATPQELGHDARSRPARPGRAGALELQVAEGRRGIYDPDPRSTRQASILGVVVALLLAIVCSNVANLLLSRAATRGREIALRRSVGATRARIVRQLVTEGIVLSTLGGVMGILVAFGAKRWLPFGQDASFDARMLVFVAALSSATGLAFSLVPALRATGAETASALKESSRSVARSTSRLSSALLVGQVALSVVLLVGAGLFLRTLSNLRNVDVGFDAEHVLLFRVEARRDWHDARASAVHDRIVESVAALPGVRSVSVSSVAFLTGSMSTTSIHVDGEAGGGQESRGHGAHFNVVSPEFFPTMGIPLLAGRLFDDGDRATAPAVAVVNQTAARELFGGPGAVGRRFGDAADASTEIEVVGVVRDVKYHDVRAPAPPTVYRPHAQRGDGGRVFEVKTAVPPRSLVPAVRDALRRVDPTLPLVQVSTQAEEIERRFYQERLLASAYSLFGGLAMLLASIGLFGLTSYSVAQRTSELGIRMALGAQRSDILRMVLRDSLLKVGLGLALGVVGAHAAGRLIGSLLFDLAATDALTILQAIALMMAVASAAAWLPARRAARIDPLAALRCE